MKYNIASFIFLVSNLPYWFLSLRCLNLKLRCCFSCNPERPLLILISYCWGQGCGSNIAVVVGQQMSVGSRAGDAGTPATIGSSGGVWELGGKGASFSQAAVCGGSRHLVAGWWVLVLRIRVVCCFAQKGNTAGIFLVKEMNKSVSQGSSGLLLL